MIALVFALEFEAADFIARSPKRMLVDVWPLGITGHRATTVLERRLATLRPSVVISAGFAGALNERFPVGSVVMAENLSCPELLDLLSTVHGLRLGNLTTLPKVAATAAEKARIAESTGADLVDMETSHLADICQREGVPFLAIRAVSDASNEDLPIPAEVLIDPSTARPDMALIFRHLFTHPGSVRNFGQMVQNARTARTRLTDSLEAIIPRLLRFGQN